MAYQYRSILTGYNEFIPVETRAHGKFEACLKKEVDTLHFIRQRYQEHHRGLSLLG